MKTKCNYTLMRERLKNLRKQKGWTQDQATEAIGAGRGAWQQWELGKRNPSHTALIAISYVFNVNFEYVCGLTDVSTPPTMLIPNSRLQGMDRLAIETYLNLTSKEKEFVRRTMDFIQMHRRKE